MNKRKYLLLIIISCFIGCKTKVLEEKKDINSKERITLKLENGGIAGNTAVNLKGRLEADVLSQNPDLVILMVGTNDMLNSKKFVSYQDYKQNLSEVVKRIKENGSQVLLMSPPTVDSLYLFMRHDKTVFTDTPNIKLQKAKEIIEQVAQDNDAFYVDNYNVFKAKGLPVHNKDEYIRNQKNSNVKDGVHLKPKGYKLIAQNVYAYLKANKLLDKYNYIICFGDSLTKGSGAEGAGTITGENYPSFLYAMLTAN